MYEIRLGLNGNSLHQIGRKINTETLVEVWEQNLLSDARPIKVVIEVTTKGEIRVWTSHNPWVPLMTAHDPKLIEINYLGFASSTRGQFFWDVNEKLIIKLPTKTDESETNELLENIKHPLLASLDYPVGVSDLCKSTF